MKIHQVLIYQALDKGFKNILSSEGVLKDEIEEIKYKFKQTCNTTYSYFRLKSSRYSFTKTTCIENIIIIHSFIIDKEINFYPYEVIDSLSFIGKIGVNELDEINQIDFCKKINENAILEFIRLRNPKIIRDMINAVIGFNSSSRGICIVDSKENFVNFLGAIHRAFPVRLSKNITFTNCKYLRNDKDFIIHFSDGISGCENSYIFDFLREIKAVVEREYKYSELVEIGYYASYQTLKTFHRFLEDFTNEDIGKEIDFSYILFVLLNINTISIQSSDINGALEFFLKYCEGSELQGIFEKYHKVFSGMIPKLDQKGAFILSEIVFRATSSLNNIPAYEEAIRIFFLNVDHLIVNIKVDSIYEWFNKHFDYNKENNIFLKYQLSADRIKYILKILSENGMKREMIFYNQAILKSACELGYSWNQILGIDAMEVLLDLSSNQIIESKNDTREILETASESKDIFIHILLLLYNRASNDYQINFIVERFIDVLDRQEEKNSSAIRREVYRLSGGKLLIKEFSTRLENSIDKVEFFKGYLVKVFYNIPDYYNKYFSEAAKTYLYSLDSEVSYRESLSLIELIEKNLVAFEVDAIKAVISVFEKGISLDNIDFIKDSIIKVKKLKRKYGIETYCDITALLSYIYNLDDSEEDIGIQDAIENLYRYLQRLEDEKARKYLSLSIPKIIERVKSKDDHKIIVGYLFSGDDEGKFIENYILVIESLLNRNREVGYRVFMHFIVYYFFYLEVNCRLLGENEIIEKIENNLMGVILKRDREFLLELDRDIRKEFNENGYSIPVKWGQMFSKSIESKSLKSKLKNIFKK